MAKGKGSKSREFDLYVKDHAAYALSKEQLERRRLERVSKHTTAYTPSQSSKKSNASPNHAYSSSETPNAATAAGSSVQPHASKPRAPPLARKRRNPTSHSQYPNAHTSPTHASFEEQLTQLEQSGSTATSQRVPAPSANGRSAQPTKASQQQDQQGSDTNAPDDASLNRCVASALEYSSAADERSQHLERNNAELNRRVTSLEQQVSTLQQANAELRRVVESLVERLEHQSAVSYGNVHTVPSSSITCAPAASSSSSFGAQSQQKQHALGRSPSVETALVSGGVVDDRGGNSGALEEYDVDEEELPTLAEYRSQQDGAHTESPQKDTVESSSSTPQQRDDAWAKPVVSSEQGPKMKEGSAMPKSISPFNQQSSEQLEYAVHVPFVHETGTQTNADVHRTSATAPHAEV